LPTSARYARRYAGLLALLCLLEDADTHLARQDALLRRRSAAAPPLPLSPGGASLGEQSAAALPSASELFPSQHAALTAQLLLWWPLGSVLAPLRIAVWLFCAALDSPGLTNSDAALDVIITKLLGVTTEWKGLENVPPGMHVMVSNHTCVGDFLLLYRQPRRYTHLIHAAVPTGGRVTQHRVSFMHSTPSTFKSLRRQAALDSSNSIHMFPESCMSSGKAVLQFSRGFALLQAPVLPVAFRATHALGISTHTLTSSFAANLWWLCFAPWTRLQATVLPAMRQGADEETEAFVERVRGAIADELRVPKVQLGVKEKYGLKEALRAVPHARL